MSKYRKKPVVIDAEQWLGWSADGVQEQRLGLHTHPTSLVLARIETLEGGHDVTPSDWIITGVAGETYPCKDAIFQQTYERVEEPPMPEPTPGSRAYEAYRADLGSYVLPWSTLTAREQRAWEAAAQAVLAWVRPRLVPVENPEFAPWRALAQEARPFLEAAFGAVLREIVVQVVHDAGSGDSLMRVVAHVASIDRAYLDGRLRLFDETWWLANCHRAGGHLVFDYESRGLDDATPPGP